MTNYDVNFAEYCLYGQIQFARQDLNEGKVSSEQIFRSVSTSVLSSNNRDFAGECLAYLQRERPDDPHTKALQVILCAYDKNYSEALELIRTPNLPDSTFLFLMRIAKERNDEDSRNFLANCLDFIDPNSFYRLPGYERIYPYEISNESLLDLIKLAQAYNKTDFIEGCLASECVDRMAILSMFKDDERLPIYLNAIVSQNHVGVSDIHPYVDFVFSNRDMDEETKKKCMKVFVDAIANKNPNEFPSLFVDCFCRNEGVSDLKLLGEFLSPEQLIQVIACAKSKNQTAFAEQLAEYLSQEKQFQALSEVTGLSAENEINHILTQLSLGRSLEDRVYVSQSIVELKTFSAEERAFFVAILSGNQDKAIELYNSGKIDINKTLGGRTALMYAISGGGDKLVSFLLQQEGLNPLIMDQKQQTALDYARVSAISEENKQAIEAMVDDGQNHSTRLFETIANNNFEAVTRLLRNGSTNINVRNEEGKSAIVVALEQGHFEIAKLLIEKGIDLNQGGYEYLDAHIEELASRAGGIEFLKSVPNYSPIIPLLEPSRYDNALIQSLVDQGVDINATRNGVTPLETSILQTTKDFKPGLSAHTSENIEEEDIAQAQDLLYMHPRNENNVPIIKNPATVLYQVAKRTSLVYAKNSDIDFGYAKEDEGYIVDSHGQQHPIEDYLVDVVSVANNPMLLSLLSNGVDINATDENGDTALKKAVLANDFDAAFVLLRNGANPNHPCLQGVEWPRFVQIARTIYEEKNRPYAAYFSGEDLYARVFSRGTVEEAINLCSGVDENGNSRINQEYKGYTPLMWAIMANRPDVVRAFLEMNPDIAIQTPDGKTVLELAAERHNPYIYRMIDEYAQKDPRTQGFQGVVNPESENLQALFSAIRELNIERVKEITAGMPRLNIQDSEGNSPAKMVCELIVAMALSNGPESGQGIQYTPENIEKLGDILMHLQEKGATLYGAPLMILCQALPQAVQNCKDQRDCLDRGDGLPFFDAHDKLRALETVICDVIRTSGGGNFCDDKGNTPLHYAVQAGSGFVAEELLKNRWVNVDQKNDVGFSPRDLIKNFNERADLEILGALKWEGDGDIQDTYLRRSARKAREQHAAIANHEDQRSWQRSTNRVSVDNPGLPVVSDKPYGNIPNLSGNSRDFGYLLSTTNPYHLNHPTNRVFELLEAYKNAQGRESERQINPTIDLIGAIENGITVESLRTLIEQGGNVDQTDANEETPLILSARCILPDFVEVLIEQGADVNKKNNLGQTVLDCAIEGLNAVAANPGEMAQEDIDNLIKTIRILKMSGAKCDMGKLSEEALGIEGVREAFAVKSEQEVIKRALFTQFEREINWRALDPNDRKPLIIKLLETRDIDLIEIGLKSSRITAEALLERGAGRESLNAIDVAYATEEPEIIEAMEEALKRTGLVLNDYNHTVEGLGLAKNGNFDAIEYKNLDLRVVDEDRKNLLHHAAEQGRIDVIEKLLKGQRYAQDLRSLTQPDKNGNTPLDLLRLNKNVSQEEKNEFAKKYLLIELQKENPNYNVVTELLEVLDKEALEALKANQSIEIGAERVDINETVVGSITDQLHGMTEEEGRTASYESTRTGSAPSVAPASRSSVAPTTDATRGLAGAQRITDEGAAVDLTRTGGNSRNA